MTMRPRRHPKGHSQKDPLPPPLPPVPMVQVNTVCIGCSFQLKISAGEITDSHPTCPHCGLPMLATSAEVATC